MNAEENIKRKFGDKEYNAYEATQRQRELERVMRKYGEETHLLELGGADEDTVLATKVRYQTASQEYAAFSKAMGLPQQRERIRNGMESLAQYAQTAQKPLDFSGGSGIIKSIDVDDYKAVIYGKGIESEVDDIILNTLKKCEKDGGFVISEISSEISSIDSQGTPVLQIEPMANGLIKLNVNTKYLSGKTLEEIDADFAKTESNVVTSLEEAVVHESGHAISIKGKTAKQIEELYSNLQSNGMPGVSDIALKDGAECLAELEVLRYRKITVSKELADFYEKYMGRKYL